MKSNSYFHTATFSQNIYGMFVSKVKSLKKLSDALYRVVHVFTKWRPTLNYESYQKDCFDTAYKALNEFGCF